MCPRVVRTGRICDGAIVLRPVRRARAGWDEAFRRMAEAGDDAMIDANRWTATQWDKDEWTW